MKSRTSITLASALIVVNSLVGCAATAPLMATAVTGSQPPVGSAPATASNGASASTPIGGTPAAAIDAAAYIEMPGSASFQGQPFAFANLAVEDALNSTPLVVLQPGDTPPTSGMYVDGLSVATDANGNFNLKVANLTPSTVLRITARTNGQALTALMLTVPATKAKYALRQAGLAKSFGLSLDETSTALEIIARAVVKMASSLTPAAAVKAIAILQASLNTLAPQVATAVSNPAGAQPTCPTTKTDTSNPATAGTAEVRKLYCNYRILAGTQDYSIFQVQPPGKSALNPGLYVQVIDGVINLRNGGGTQNFSAGQFGFTPGFIQPPVILPNNPGLQFTPPPAFSSSTNAQQTSGSGKPKTVDCEVRYAVSAVDCTQPTTKVPATNDNILKQLLTGIPGLQASVDAAVSAAVVAVSTSAAIPANVKNVAALANNVFVGTNISVIVTNGQVSVSNAATGQSESVNLATGAATNTSPATVGANGTSGGGGNGTVTPVVTFRPTVSSIVWHSVSKVLNMTVIQPGSGQIDVQSLFARIPATGITLSSGGPENVNNPGMLLDPVTVATSTVTLNAGAGLGTVALPLVIGLVAGGDPTLNTKPLEPAAFAGNTTTTTTTFPAYAAYLSVAPPLAPKIPIATFQIFKNETIGATTYDLLNMVYNTGDSSTAHLGSTTTLATNAFTFIPTTTTAVDVVFTSRDSQTLTQIGAPITVQAD